MRSFHCAAAPPAGIPLLGIPSGNSLNHALCRLCRFRSWLSFSGPFPYLLSNKLVRTYVADDLPRFADAYIFPGEIASFYVTGASTNWTAKAVEDSAIGRGERNTSRSQTHAFAKTT
jgi:hypothetical protein